MSGVHYTRKCILRVHTVLVRGTKPVLILLPKKYRAPNPISKCPVVFRCVDLVQVNPWIFDPAICIPQKTVVGGYIWHYTAGQTSDSLDGGTTDKFTHCSEFFTLRSA